MPKTWYILTSAIHEDKPKEWHYYTKSWLITHVIDMFRFKLIIFLICDIYLKTKCEVVENNNDGEGEELDWAHLEFLSFTPVASRGDVNVGKRSVSAVAVVSRPLYRRWLVWKFFIFCNPSHLHIPHSGQQTPTRQKLCAARCLYNNNTRVFSARQWLWNLEIKIPVK